MYRPKVRLVKPESKFSVSIFLRSRSNDHRNRKEDRELLPEWQGRSNLSTLCYLRHVTHLAASSRDREPKITTIASSYGKIPKWVTSKPTRASIPCLRTEPGVQICGKSLIIKSWMAPSRPSRAPLLRAIPRKAQGVTENNMWMTLLTTMRRSMMSSSRPSS